MKVTVYPIYIVHVEESGITSPEPFADYLWEHWNPDGSIMYAFPDEESAEQAKAAFLEQANADN